MADQSSPQIRPIVTYSEAKQRGLKRYFTGKPCGYGHIAERYTANGMCADCLADKQRFKRLTPKRGKYFSGSRCKNGHISERTPSGFCIECRRAWDRAWGKDNPDKRRAKRAARVAKYRDKIRAQNRAWHKKNPHANATYTNRRRARIKQSGGKFTAADIDGLFTQQRGKCAYCRVLLKKPYHIDHIKPLARGGTNWPANLQLCCSACNASKGTRDAEEFARSQGLLL